MASIAFDESRYPLVVVTFDGTASDQAFTMYLEKLSEVASRRQKYVTILDARSAGVVSPTHRKRQADWIAANQAALKRYSCGTAFVISSAVIRGALTAILWLQPMPVPHIVLGTLDAAEQWATRQLANEGISVPPRSGRPA